MSLLASFLNQQPHSTVTHTLRMHAGQQRDEVRAPLPYWPSHHAANDGVNDNGNANADANAGNGNGNGNGNAAVPPAKDAETLKRLQWLEALHDADADADNDYSGAAAVGKQLFFQLGIKAGDPYWYTANITAYNPATKQHKIVPIDKWDGVVTWMAMDDCPHKALPHSPKPHIVGDTWSAHMPFIEDYIQLRPTIKIIIVEQKNCIGIGIDIGSNAVVSSSSHTTVHARNASAENDWLPPPYFKHMALRDARVRYCEQMRNMTQLYRTQYPNNVRVYDADALLLSTSSPVGRTLRDQMLTWIGYSQSKRLLDVPVLPGDGKDGTTIVGCNYN